MASESCITFKHKSTKPCSRWGPILLGKKDKKGKNKFYKNL